MKTTLFYQISQTRREYLGIRFFRWNPNSGEVVQVCVTSGEPRRGRANNFGIYHITQVTFFQNYLALQYAIPCKESQFREAFSKVLDVLKK